MATVSPDQLGQAVGEVLQTFNHSVVTSVDEAAKECGRIGADLLKSTSPRKSGKYSRGWGIKQTKSGTVYIYNKKHYRLTHLLERGHRTIIKNGKYGMKASTRAIPHIASAEDYVQEQFPAMISKRISMQK